MCKVLDKESEIFGSMNMIFARDFAQLPPSTDQGSLYSQSIESIIYTINIYKRQEASIGKVVWHQFTTMVILQQNMRQHL